MAPSAQNVRVHACSGCDNVGAALEGVRTPPTAVASGQQLGAGPQARGNSGRQPDNTDRGDGALLGGSGGAHRPHSNSGRGRGERGEGVEVLAG